MARRVAIMPLSRRRSGCGSSSLCCDGLPSFCEAGIESATREVEVADDPNSGTGGLEGVCGGFA